MLHLKLAKAETEAEVLKADVRKLEETRKKLLRDAESQETRYQELAEKMKTSERMRKADAGALEKAEVDLQSIESSRRVAEAKLNEEREEFAVQNMVIKLYNKIINSYYIQANAHVMLEKVFDGVSRPRELAVATRMNVDFGALWALRVDAERMLEGHEGLERADITRLLEKAEAPYSRLQADLVALRQREVPGPAPRSPQNLLRRD